MCDIIDKYLYSKLTPYRSAIRDDDHFVWHCEAWTRTHYKYGIQDPEIILNESCEKNDLDSVVFLLHHYPKNLKLKQAFRIACENNNLKISKYLFAKSQSIQKLIVEQIRCIIFYLLQRENKDSYEMIEWLISNYHVKIL